MFFFDDAPEAPAETPSWSMFDMFSNVGSMQTSTGGVGAATTENSASKIGGSFFGETDADFFTSRHTGGAGAATTENSSSKIGGMVIGETDADFFTSSYTGGAGAATTEKSASKIGGMVLGETNADYSTSSYTGGDGAATTENSASKIGRKGHGETDANYSTSSYTGGAAAATTEKSASKIGGIGHGEADANYSTSSYTGGDGAATTGNSASKIGGMGHGEIDANYSTSSYAAGVEADGARSPPYNEEARSPPQETGAAAARDRFRALQDRMSGSPQVSNGGGDAPPTQNYKQMLEHVKKMNEECDGLQERVCNVNRKYAEVTLKGTFMFDPLTVEMTTGRLSGLGLDNAPPAHLKREEIDAAYETLVKRLEKRPPPPDM